MLLGGRRSGFFLSTFGFEEGSSYVKNQENLLRIASFKEVPIEIPSSEPTIEFSSSSSSSSSSISYFREQCDFTFSDGKTLSAGIFSMPTLAELRDHANLLFVKNNNKKKAKNENENYGDESGDENGDDESAIITVQNVKGESRSLHMSKEVLYDYSGRKSKAPIVVQAASQFNTLEFISPQVVPEKGISRYEFDGTQGPACAIACAAGTAYRNYLVSGNIPAFAPLPPPPQSAYKDNDDEKDPLSLPMSDRPCTHRGQRHNHQLNGLADVEDYLLQEIGLEQTPWIVKNGYVESSHEILSPLIKLLSESEQDEDADTDKLLLKEEIISRVRTGVQQDTTVTDDTSWNTKVTQTYNSALSIGYSNLAKETWQPLAQIILDATYEATLLVGVLQSREESPPPIVFLTKVGGGVFDNKDDWIRSAMARAIEKVKAYGVPLDIRVVHHGNIDENYKQLESS